MGIGTKAFAVFGEIGLKDDGDVKRQLKDVTAEAKKYEGMLTSSAARAGAAALGLAAVAFGVSSVKAYQESQIALVKLQNTLSNMPKLQGATTRAFEEQAKAIQKLTAADDEEIITAQAMLGTFQTTQDQILELTPLIVDFSRKFGVDMVSASKLAGKALEGQISAFKRQGISIDENLYATDRYAAVMKALREQVGGYAEQEAASGAVATIQLKNAFADLQEIVGEELAPALVDVTNGITEMLQGFGELSEDTQKTVIGIGAVGTAALVAIPYLGTLIRALRDLGITATTAAGAAGTGGIVGLAAKLPALLMTINPLVAGLAVFIYKMQQVDDSANNFSRSMVMNGDSLEDMQKIVDDGKATWEDFARATQEVEFSLLSEAEKAEIATRAGMTLDQAIAIYGDDAAEAAVQTDTLTRAIDGSMVAADSAAGKFRTLTDLDIAQQLAVLDLNAARERLNEVMKDSESTADDVARAQLGVEQAELRVNDAAADMAAAVSESLGTSYDNANSIASIEAVTAALQAAMNTADSARSAMQRALSLKVLPAGVTSSGLQRHGGGGIPVSGMYSLQAGEYVLRETQVERIIERGGSVSSSMQAVIIADPRYTDMAKLERDVQRINSSDIASGDVLAALGIG